MFCDRHDFGTDDDGSQRCCLPHGHRPPCVDVDDVPFERTSEFIRRRTTWFKLAFGSWGAIDPPQHSAEVLTWLDLGWWPDVRSTEEITQPG